MASPDIALIPGDIVRGVVDHVDSSLDACFLDAGQHGTLFIPLAGLSGATISRIVPNARVCAQIIAPQRGKKLPRASVSIEFSGRTSVLILDGAALTGTKSPAKVEVFVSKKVGAVQRAELASKLESALEDPSTGLPVMLSTAVGPMTVILRTAAADTPWEQVLSAVVVQLTEAAAFTVLARAGSEPALLMSEKTDADGDALIVSQRFSDSADMLDGRRLGLPGGGEIVFERTEAMWTVDVNTAHAHAVDKPSLIRTVNREAASVICESVLEYDVSGLIAIDFVTGMTSVEFNALSDDISDALGTEGVYVSGDFQVGVVLVSRKSRLHA